MKSKCHRELFIAKPSAGGCGFGIKLIRRIEEIDIQDLIDRKYVV